MTKHRLFAIALSLAAVAKAAHADSLLPSATMQSAVILTDPELSGSIAAPPLQAPLPPAGVQLPKAVNEHGQWRGSQCGITTPRFAAFRHPDKWETFWKQALTPYSATFAALPVIDFSKEMVIGVFMGERTIPNYEVKILSTKIEDRPTGRVLVVRFRETERMIGVFAPPFPVQPFHLKRVTRFDGPIVFHRSVR